MSAVSTPVASGSSNISEVGHTLRVMRAKLIEGPRKKDVLYVEIKLPNRLQVFTHTVTVESSKLERNGKFDFTSPQTDLIRITLKKRQGIWLDMCLGEASVSVGELNARCQGAQDYSLVLVNPRSKLSVGTLLIQLQVKAQLPQNSLDLTGSRQKVENMRSKLVETYSRKYPDKFRPPSTSPNVVSTVGGREVPDGFEILNRVRNQLDSMNSGKLKTALGVIDAAAKIHPCVESSWKIVSSLHGAYQKKHRMDSQIIGIFASMNHVLSFVEDVDRLKDKEQQFFNLIEQSLRIIEDCGSFILGYLNDNTRGRMQSAPSGEERLSYYQDQLKDLAEDLTHRVNVHVAHRVDDNHEVIEVLTHHVEDNHKATEALTRRVEDGQKTMEVLTHRVEDGYKTVEVLTHRVEGNHSEVMKGLHRIEGKIPSSQPSSSSSFQPIIPPPPTDMFTGRGDYLKTMETSFEFPKTSIETTRQRRFVLYGTGGMGKTQLALKFLDENRNNFTMRYIIDASSSESIAASFANIGRDAGIPDADVHKVLEWLSKKIEDWILIFDNADNRDVKLRPYFPNCRHGNILITTRNADYESLAPSLEVSVLEVSSAVALLLRIAKLEETEENGEMARKIVGEFGHLALAIVQAGSYVRAEHLTLHGYYDRYERSRISLLKSGPLKEELAYERPVYATWEISYAALSPFAKTMLDLCAFLYREGITEELWLRAVASEKAKLAMESEKDDPTAPKELLSLVRYLRLDSDNDAIYVVRFREIVRELRSYSLIQEPSRGSFSIHPLVHSWARERMKSSRQLEVQTNTTLLLHYSLRGSVYDLYVDSGFTRTILPHIESCGNPLRADIALEFVGVYAACGRENDPQIQKLLTTALTDRKQFEIGNQHTYDSRNHLAVLYNWLHRYSEAAEILQILVEEQRGVLGINHAETLSSMHELAHAFRIQQQLDNAAQLFAEVVDAKKRLLGNDHSDTFESMHELASTYRDQRRLDDAQELFAEVIEARKRVLGNDHSDTLYSMHGLALIYQDQGRLDGAVELFVEVIKARKRVLGNDHSQTLISMHCLALIYRDQGRLEDAQELFIEVIAARERVLSNDHSDTLSSMHSLAWTYRNQGRLNDAQKLFVEVIEARKRVLGNDHYETLWSMYRLASTYLDQSHVADAEELGIEVYERYKRVFGLYGYRTIRSRDLLIEIYTQQGRLGDAGRLKALNSNHPWTS